MSEGNFDSILRWLEGVNRSEIQFLQQNHTAEYASFIQAFQNLEQTHRNAVTLSQAARSDRHGLRLHNISDPLILRICDFLTCFHLVSFGKTNHRFHSLSESSAKIRTSHLNSRSKNGDGRYYHPSYFRLLRAKEQSEGILPLEPSVRIPLFGLAKRVIVSQCGDEEFNGVYCCTGSNGNGFLFTKPRFEKDRFQQQHLHPTGSRSPSVSEPSEGVFIPEEDVFPSNGNGNTNGNANGGHDRFLRCIISKRFSNETILWYMSKEVQIVMEEEDDNDEGMGMDLGCSNNTHTGRAGAFTVTRAHTHTHRRRRMVCKGTHQEYAFYSNLMTSEEGSPGTCTCTYPSQTSIQARNGQHSWLSLSRHRQHQHHQQEDEDEGEGEGEHGRHRLGALSPPIVELLG